MGPITFWMFFYSCTAPNSNLTHSPNQLFFIYELFLEVDVRTIEFYWLSLMSWVYTIGWSASKLEVTNSRVYVCREYAFTSTFERTYWKQIFFLPLHFIFISHTPSIFYYYYYYCCYVFKTHPLTINCINCYFLNCIKKIYKYILLLMPISKYNMYLI